MKPETLKLLKIKQDHTDIVSKNFLNTIPFAQEIRATIDKWHFIELKRLQTAKKTKYSSGEKDT